MGIFDRFKKKTSNDEKKVAPEKDVKVSAVKVPSVKTMKKSAPVQTSVRPSEKTPTTKTVPKKKKGSKPLDESAKEHEKRHETEKEETVAKTKDGESKAERKEDTGNAYKVLMHPVVSEKSAGMAQQGKYVFSVEKNTNKIEIKKAIQNVYGVRVIDITTVVMYGKRKRFGRIAGRRSSWKKAVVTLAAGQSIDLYEGV